MERQELTVEEKLKRISIEDKKYISALLDGILLKSSQIETQPDPETKKAI